MTRKPEDTIDEGYLDEPMQVPGDAAAGSIVFSSEEKTPLKVFEPDDSVLLAETEIEALKAGKASGTRGKTRKISRTGRYVRSAPVKERDTGFDVAIDATLRAAALRRASADDRDASTPVVQSSDLRKKVRKRLRKNLVVFVVDSSDSMGTGERMAAAKGAILALLKSAYQKRDRVALVSFREEKAEILLHPTNSVALARQKLKRLPTGGATPFADGLKKAWQIVKTERIRDPDLESLIVVISDGKANVPLEKGRPVMEELSALGRIIKKDNIHSIVIDTNKSGDRTSNMPRLADSLGAAYHHIDRLRVSRVVELIQSAGNP